MASNQTVGVDARRVGVRHQLDFDPGQTHVVIDLRNKDSVTVCTPQAGVRLDSMNSFDKNGGCSGYRCVTMEVNFEPRVAQLLHKHQKRFKPALGHKR